MKVRLSCFKHPAALMILLLAVPLWAQSMKTPAEESGWSRYTQYEDVTRFLQALDKASKETVVQVIGKTLDAKELPAANLYLCIITEEGVESPKALNRKKPTFMITASQHGNEQSAKEAALRVIRDLATGELKPLLKQLNFLVIPQANPYGNFVDRRQNEQNLDLNRDHVKL
jgi:murein tripeptide amidase MpaA